MSILQGCCDNELVYTGTQEAAATIMLILLMTLIIKIINNDKILHNSTLLTYWLVLCSVVYSACPFLIGGVICLLYIVYFHRFCVRVCIHTCKCSNRCFHFPIRNLPLESVQL